MLRMFLVLIFSPVIILAATLLVCAVISAGFEVLLKIAIIAAIICGVKYVFSKCKEGA